MASTASLSPCTTLSTPGGKPASWNSSQISIDAEGSRSDGLSTKVLPQATATGYIHIGTMAGKLNGRDAGDHAERLAVRPAVDVRPDIAAVLALQEMRDAAGEIDHVDAAGKLAERVFMRLAMLVGDRPCDVVGMTIEKLLEAEHGLDALQRRRRAPGHRRFLGGGDGLIHVRDARQRQRGDLLARRGIVDGRDARRCGGDRASVDGVLYGQHGATYRFSLRGLEDAGKNVDELIDFLLVDDERRRQRDDVAGGANEEAAIERLDEARMRAATRRARGWDRTRRRRSARYCGCR